MQSLKPIGLLTLFFSLSLFILSCGGNAAQEQGENAEETMEMEATSTDAAATEAPAGEGKEYTSTYVCTMHCKGSGSEEAGKCPVCGMDYVALAEHTKDGHSH